MLHYMSFPPYVKVFLENKNLTKQDKKQDLYKQCNGRDMVSNKKQKSMVVLAQYKKAPVF